MPFPDLATVLAKGEARVNLLEKFFAEENIEDCIQLFHYVAEDSPRSRVPNLIIGRNLKELAEYAEPSDVIEALDNCDFIQRYWAVLNLDKYTIEAYDYDEIMPLIENYSWEIGEWLGENCERLQHVPHRVPNSILKLCEKFEEIE